MIVILYNAITAQNECYDKEDQGCFGVARSPLRMEGTPYFINSLGYRKLLESLFIIGTILNKMRNLSYKI